MRKPIWWIASVGVLVLLSWVTYRVWRPSVATVAALVPPDALLVLESRTLQETIASQSGQMSLRQLPVFDVALSRLERLFTNPTDTTTRRAFLTNKAVCYSLHPASKAELDFIFYVPTRSADQAFLERFQQPDPNRYRVLSRQFSGQTIYELRDLSNRSYGSFLEYADYLIGSPSGVLLENVIRHVNKPFRSPGFSLPQSADNVATMYVRPDVLRNLVGDPKTTNSLLSVFLPESLTFQFRRSTLPTHWLGFASDPVGNRQSVANLFAGQTPRRIGSGALIPQQTATFYHIGLSDTRRFGRAIVQLLETGDNSRLIKRLGRIDNLLPDFYGQLAGDVLLCRMEANTQSAGQVLLLEADDARALSQTIQRMAYQLTSSPAPAAPRTYLGHKLLPLPIDELPATLLSSLFAGFPQAWITQHGRHVVLANSEESLQTYLTALTEQTVWSADGRLAALLTQTLRPAHLTTFTRLPRSGSAFLKQWPTSWQTLLGPAPFANIDNLAYQATYGQDHILSTLVLGRNAQRPTANVLNRLLLRKRIPFNASLIASPVVVGRLSDPTAQIWAQNSAQQFVLLTTEKDKIVQDTTDGPIQSNVVAVDWRSNGRLQYLFMTKRSLYVADLGNKRVQLQRIKLPAGIETTYLALPKGRNRQLDLVALMAHKDGSVYALDRKQKKLVRQFVPQRTSPLRLPFQVIDRDRELEVMGLQTNGLLNRWVIQTGQPVRQVPNFPLLVKRPTDSSDLDFAGPSLWLSTLNQIATVSTAGELLTLNAAGQISRRKQLYRPLRGGQFRLFPDVEQTGYLMLHTTETEITVLDAEGNRLFELRDLNPERTHVQYHRFGAGVEVLAVQSGGFTTLYNRAGQRIGDRPIPSDFPVTLQFDEQGGELYIVSSIQKAVQLFSIRMQ